MEGIESECNEEEEKKIDQQGRQLKIEDQETSYDGIQNKEDIPVSNDIARCNTT